MPTLRPYQAELFDSIVREFMRVRGVLMRLATGGGKTVVIGAVARWFSSLPLGSQTWATGIGCLMAHRQELVGQLSLQLAREGIYHEVVCSDSTRRDIVRSHMEELGRNYVQPGSSWHVASVDTLIKRDEPWMERCGLVVPDEGHHVLRKNKWGKVIAKMPLARILLPSATPGRADGAGLGSHADGVADVMIHGPSMRWLIDNGFLTPYRIICPPNKLDRTQIAVGDSGDFSPKAAAAAVHKAQITGDVVASYLKFAAGKRGVTFAVDVADATEIARKYRDAGVPAEVVTAKTPDALRRSLVRQLRNGTLLQLVNVDLFGEGFDLPAIEVVSMARPTQSFAVYAQQFGRALRLMEGKTEAIIIDHVGNVAAHLPPDWRVDWTLDAAERRSKSGPSLVKICANPDCARSFARELGDCPYCEWRPEAGVRSGPEWVDGNLEEVDAEWMAERSREINRINGDPPPMPHLSGPAQGAVWKRHVSRREEHQRLRHMADTWAACQGDLPLAVLYRRFYLTFGLDLASAQSLTKEAEARDLRERIEARIVADGYVINRGETA